METLLYTQVNCSVTASKSCNKDQSTQIKSCTEYFHPASSRTKITNDILLENIILMDLVVVFKTCLSILIALISIMTRNTNIHKHREHINKEYKKYTSFVTLCLSYQGLY